MADKNLIQEFRLKNTDETRNYLIEEIKMNWWVKRLQRFVQL